MYKRLKIALVVIGVFALAAVVIGIFFDTRSADLLQNLGTEALGIVITVGFIDEFIRRREAEELKEYLISQLSDNENATPLFNKIINKGWGYDESLRNLRIQNSDLKRVNLIYKDIRGSHFYNVNMDGADIGEGKFRD